MARARRRSRTPGGRTERRSRRGHHPAHGAGKVRADAPRDTRRAGYSQPKRHLPRSRKRGVRGCRGDFPLSPHAPRRADDPPPAPGSSRDARKKKKGSVSPPSPASPHAPRRAGDLPPTPGSSRDARKKKKGSVSPLPPLTPCSTPGRRPAAHTGQQPQCKEEQK